MTTHDHGNCAVCDLQDAEIKRLRAEVARLQREIANLVRFGGPLGEMRERAEKAEAEVERLRDDNLGLQGAYTMCVEENGKSGEDLAAHQAVVRELADKIEQMEAWTHEIKGNLHVYNLSMADTNADRIRAVADDALAHPLVVAARTEGRDE